MVKIQHPMKPLITTILLLYLVCGQLPAQNFMLTFVGVGSVVDSVVVQNLSQGTMQTLSGQDTLYLVKATGILPHNPAASDLKIFPNPGQGQSLVSFNSQYIGSISIRLFDPSGTLVLSEAIVSQGGSHQMAIAGLGKGMYFIQVVSGQECLTGKLISVGVSSTTPYIQSYTTAPTNGNTHKIGGITSILPMQYNAGEVLLLKGFSGQNSRHITLIPTQSQTITFAFIECMDGDSNHYPVVEIGTQLWMAENLRTTRY